MKFSNRFGEKRLEPSSTPLHRSDDNILPPMPTSDRHNNDDVTFTPASFKTTKTPSNAGKKASDDKPSQNLDLKMSKDFDTSTFCLSDDDDDDFDKEGGISEEIESDFEDVLSHLSFESAAFDSNISKAEKAKKKKLGKKPMATPAAVRKYHYSPHTITGKVKPKTLRNLEEPDGVHNCEKCPAVFNKSAALKSHVSRYHHPNLTAKCPECSKMLSSHSAIKKHLLSHRPKSEWPFECPLCLQKFQARGDLPKHFNTFAHKNDKRVPQPGTSEWFQILERSCVNPELMTTRKIKLRRNKK